MSGHSKWHKIQHKKGKNDKARGAVFTKTLKAITVAAQQGGGDPEMNFALRLAIDKAKASNVPKDNIQRAIERGTGEGKDAAQFEEALYEGFGPSGVALLIDCLTDNKNRTVSDVKYILSKNGGSAAGPGSVQWQFERKGVVRISAEQKNDIQQWEEAQLSLMDAGALDIEESEFGVQIVCAIENLQTLVHAVEVLDVQIQDSGLEWIAKESIEIDEAAEQQLQILLDAFEENEDVREVYSNVA